VLDVTPQMRRRLFCLDAFLKSETFDEDAYKSAMKNLREAQDDLVTFKTQMSIDLLKDASPKERRAIMKKIMKPMRQRGDKRPRFEKPKFDAEQESDNEVHKDKVHYYKAFDL
jgi:hypothetical protein